MKIPVSDIESELEVRCGICGKGCFAHSDSEVDECFDKILDSLK